MKLTALAVSLAFAPVAAQKVDFMRDIQPIFKDRCYSCHGPDEQDAELRMDLRTSVFDDLGIVVPEELEDSVLFERITLEADDPDIMPNEGDPLTENQIALIKRWIEQGASWPEAADADAHAADARREANKIVIRELTAAEEVAEQRAIDTLRSKGALAMAISQDSHGKDVNLSLLGDQAGDAEVELLRGLEPSLVWLNLSRTEVTDEGVARLAAFKQLRRLNLARTAVGDAGLVGVARLEQLEYLNLYGSKVTDAGLKHLAKLPKLRKLYLWQTGATERGVKQLKASLPDVVVDLGGYARVIEEVSARIEAEKAAKQPVNDVCPVKGTKADPSITATHDGKRIAFCCNNCLAAFQKNPKQFSSKLKVK